MITENSVQRMQKIEIKDPRSRNSMQNERLKTCIGKSADMN